MGSELLRGLSSVVVAALVISALELLTIRAEGAVPPSHNYYVYVCAESDDEVALVRFGPDGLDVVKTITVGRLPTETEGPHGIAIDPSRRHWYVTTAHGFPFGTLHKYETGTDEPVGEVELGLFPATLDVSASTGLLFVVNSDLHGSMKPGTVSVVESETMTEIERIPTGVMPHGSRFGADGGRHYSVSMMDDELVEIDGRELAVRRTLPLGDTVRPTWVTRPTSAGKVYVAGSAVDEIYEVDVEDWRITRTLDSGPGPYNLAVAPDGSTLVATYKSGAAVGFWDLPTGQERARTGTSRMIPHGVVLSPDGNFAFVTLEGIGGEPGTVEVYEVASGNRIGAVDVGKQAGGIAFWKLEP